MIVKNFVTHGETASANLKNFRYHFRLTKKKLFLIKNKQILSVMSQKFKIADSTRLQFGAAGSFATKQEQPIFLGRIGTLKFLKKFMKLITSFSNLLF